MVTPVCLLPFTYPHPPFPFLPFSPFFRFLPFFPFFRILPARSPLHPWTYDRRHPVLCSIAFLRGHVETAKNLYLEKKTWKKETKTEIIIAVCFYNSTGRLAIPVNQNKCSGKNRQPASSNTFSWWTYEVSRSKLILSRSWINGRNLAGKYFER